MSMAAENSEEWRAAERALGCEFASFRRVHAGKNSVNYRAETPEGRLYLVKFACPYRAERVLARLGAISSPLIPPLALCGRTGTFGRFVICALEWCKDGANIPPHVLTSAQIAAIVEGYRELSRAFSAVEPRLLEAPEEAVEAAKRCGAALRPIHGDFHYKNFFLDGDRFCACFDVECMRLGMPAEDLLRIFAHELDRTRFWCFRRIGRIYRNLSEMVRISGIPKAEWLEAVALHVGHKEKRRMEKGRAHFVAKIDNFLRGPYSRRLRLAVEVA